jgi:2-polyprenyl-3-methyl-5-hydroxy-6-metoxy-1,4-benzoquinol methylase
MSEDLTWDDMAADWDARDDVQRYAHLAYLSLTHHAVEQLDERCGHVLDFGAGTGVLTRYLTNSGRRIVAVDTSAAMLAVLDAKQLEGVETLCVDLCTVSEPTLVDQRAPYALILASSVCAFVPDYPELLQRFARLLRPGGRLFQWDWEHPDTGALDRPGFTHAQIAAAYEAAGLLPVTIETAFALRVEGERWPVVLGVAERR